MSQKPARRLVRLPRDLDQVLVSEAERQGVSINQLIVAALAVFLRWRDERHTGQTTQRRGHSNA